MIDILLATYNGEKYIDQQIDSIFNQTNKEWRIIAHDDGSTDNTKNILYEWERMYPSQFFVLDDNIATGSPKDNFSYLLSKSTSSYVMFADQDDFWLENKIEITYSKMLELERQHPQRAILVHSDLMVVDSELNILSDSMMNYTGLPQRACNLNELLVANNIAGCTVMVNRKAISQSIPIPTVAVMHDWWLGAITLKNGGLVYFINQPLLKYRQHDSNYGGAKPANLKFGFHRLNLNRVRRFLRVYHQARFIRQVNMFDFALKKVRLRISTIFQKQ